MTLIFKFPYGQYLFVDVLRLLNLILQENFILMAIYIIYISPYVDFMEKFSYCAKKRWQYSALKGEECNRRIHYLISVFSPWQKDFPGQECHPKKTRTHKKGITLLSNHLCDVGVSTYLPSKSLGITLKWETPIRFFAGWFSKVRIAILENVLWYGRLLTYIMYWLNPLGKW